MPGSKPGERRGGRKKGTANKASQDIAEKLQRLKCDPIEGLARIANRDLDCGVCFGRGRTKYKLPDGDIGERTCESCFGTLKERISPETHLKANAELANYVLPKRKAIEHSGSIGQPDLAAVLRERFQKRNG